MKRNANIAAVLCAAVLVAWVAARQGGPGGPRRDPAEVVMLHPLPAGAGPVTGASGPSEDAPKPARVTELPVCVCLFGDGIGLCYLDCVRGVAYRWRDVALRYEQLAGTWYHGSISGLAILDVRAYRVEATDPPVRYLAVGDRLRAGYPDPTIHAFYALRGGELSRAEACERSADGKVALLDSVTGQSGPPKVIEVDMPVHLKAHPELWKKTP